ncbi:MAG: hypothetical protein AAGF47_04060, partial [Planctomycetota bacterium]
MPVLVALLTAIAGPAAADIDKANGLLRRAEANLQSVASSLGNRTTPPRGSAGRLAAQRLQQALGDLNPAKAFLEAVPAGTEGRDEAVARYAAAAAEYNRLHAILTGGSAPPTAPSAAGPDEGVALDYRQQELLRNAQFHIREVEGNAQQLTEAVEPLRAVEDQLSVSFRDVAGLLGVVENARRKSGVAAETLDQLPT